eukprot:4919281-Amphidinium_carterae.1
MEVLGIDALALRAVVCRKMPTPHVGQSVDYGPPPGTISAGVLYRTHSVVGAGSTPVAKTCKLRSLAARVECAKIVQAYGLTAPNIEELTPYGHKMSLRKHTSKSERL